MKILFFDIESAPMLAHIWRPDDQYVPHDRLIHDSFMLCWSAKWSGDKKIVSGCLTKDEVFIQDDTRIVQGLADMVREADVIVGHNVNSFDLPMLNNRVLLLGLEPLGPTRSIDTLVLARKNFRLAYKKLDYLGDILGLGKKIRTDFDLWKSCYHGDKRSLNKMLKYNTRDVVLLEGVYRKLLPYCKNIPRLAVPEFNGQLACPFCGSPDIMKRGWYDTNTSVYQQWHCKTCLKYSRSRTGEKVRFSVAPL